jgi:hypothetical protein
MEDCKFLLSPKRARNHLTRSSRCGKRMRTNPAKSYTKKELNALVKKIVTKEKKSWEKDKKKGDNKCKNCEVSL